MNDKDNNLRITHLFDNKNVINKIVTSYFAPKCVHSQKNSYFSLEKKSKLLFSIVF